MQAAYTVADYFVPFFVCTIGSALLVGVLCVLIGRKAVKKFQKVWLPVIPLIGFGIFLFWLFGIYAFPILEQTGDLLVPSEYEIKTTAGQIEGITPAENVPIYYIDGKVCGATYISINDAQYYVISEGLLTEGMLVEVQYAAFENNVILSCKEVTADRVTQVQTENLHVQPPEDIPTQYAPTPEMEALASTLISTGVIGVACISILFSIINQRIKSYLLKQDLMVHGKIIPNRKAICFFCLPFVFFAMIIMGLWIQNGDISIFVMLLIGGGVFVLITIKMPTSLELDGNTLYLRSLGKERQYQIQDIYSVSFKSCRGFTGKQLVIIFNDRKSCWFDMDRYCGVQNVYNELTKRME